MPGIVSTGVWCRIWMIGVGPKTGHWRPDTNGDTIKTMITLSLELEREEGELGHPSFVLEQWVSTFFGPGAPCLVKGRRENGGN